MHNLHSGAMLDGGLFYIFALDTKKDYFSSCGNFSSFQTDYRSACLSTVSSRLLAADPLEFNHLVIY